MNGVRIGDLDFYRGSVGVRRNVRARDENTEQAPWLVKRCSVMLSNGACPSRAVRRMARLRCSFRGVQCHDIPAKTPEFFELIKPGDFNLNKRGCVQRVASCFADRISN